MVDPVNRLVYLDRLRSERRFLKPLLAAQPNVRYTAVVRQDRQRVMIDGNDAQMKKDAADLSPDQLRGVKAVILGDLPAAALSAAQAAALSDWVDKGGALLLMAGPSNLGPAGFATTALAKVLPIALDPPPRYVEKEFHVDLTPEGAAHPAFQKIKKSWVRAAPLLSRFDVSGLHPGATVLMASADPERSAGRGQPAIWAWQGGGGADRFDLALAVGVRPVANPAQPKTPKAEIPAKGSDYAIFWRQMIDWLLPDVKETGAGGGAGQVQLIADRTQYDLNDHVLLLASVHGSDGAAITTADVQFTITGPDGRAMRPGKYEPGSGGGAIPPALTPPCWAPTTYRWRPAKMIVPWAPTRSR